MTIVHYEHRYKRPPRKKKPVALEVPVVVRTEPTRRKPVSKKAKAPPTSAIVTIRKRGSADVPDLTPEEHQRRGDAAEALFREMTGSPPPRCGRAEPVPAGYAFMTHAPR
jgi:hypothetical protein